MPAYAINPVPNCETLAHYVRNAAKERKWLAIIQKQLGAHVHGPTSVS